MNRRLGLASLFTLSLLLACGPKGNNVDAGQGGGAGGGFVGGAGGGTGSVGLDQFCQSYSQQYCDALIRCGQMDPGFRNGCYAFLQRYTCAEMKESVTRNFATYDSQAAATCLQAYTEAFSTTCSFSQGVSNSACADVVKGNAGPNALCNQQSDCTDSNTVCSGSGCSTTCQPWGGLNEACRYGSCSQGFWCDPATTTCKTPQPVGSPCNSSSTQNPQCVDTAYCDTAQGKCVALPGSGQPCRIYTPQCGTNLYCNYGATTPTCQPYVGLDGGCAGSDPACGPTAHCVYSSSSFAYHCTPRHDLGGSCASSSDCFTTLRCLSGSCQPKGTEGQSCVSSYGECEDGLYCDQVARQCLKTRSVDAGQPCTDYSLYCNNSTCVGAKATNDGGVGTFGTCTLKGPGLPCSQQYDCGGGSYCGDAGTCVAASTGTPCISYGDNCAADSYCAQNSRCAPKGGVGATCPNNSYQACVSPYVCVTKNLDAGTGVCGTPGGPGAACLVNGAYQCLIPDECVNGLCTPIGLSGQPCSSSGGFCYDGACSGRNQDAGITGTCGAYLPAGSACQQSFECDSTNCDATTEQCIAACQ